MRSFFNLLINLLDFFRNPVARNSDKDSTLVRRGGMTPLRGFERGLLTKSARCAVLTSSVTLSLLACTAPWQNFQAGQDASVVVAKLGQPHEIYPLPNGGKRLLWTTQPYGSFATAAEIDAKGKIIYVKPILTTQEFAQAEINKWSKHDILTHFGKPAQTTYFARMQREVWSYRYQESHIYYLLYHFYFDKNGILRSTQKTLDPLHDPTPKQKFF